MLGKAELGFVVAWSCRFFDRLEGFLEVFFFISSSLSSSCEKPQ